MNDSVTDFRIETVQLWDNVGSVPPSSNVVETEVWLQWEPKH